MDDDIEQLADFGLELEFLRCGHEKEVKMEERRWKMEAIKTKRQIRDLRALPHLCQL
jgi:hypothetical protein